MVERYKGDEVVKSGVESSFSVGGKEEEEGDCWGFLDEVVVKLVLLRLAVVVLCVLNFLVLLGVVFYLGRN